MLNLVFTEIISGEKTKENNKMRKKFKKFKKTLKKFQKHRK